MADQPRQRRLNPPARKRAGPNPWVVLLVIFLAVGGGGTVLALMLQNRPQVGVTTTVARSAAGPQPGTQPPNFRLPGLGMEDRELAEFRGRPVLIVFWNSQCQPCLDMFPRLQIAAQGGDLTIIAIHTTFQDAPDQASAALQPYNLPQRQFYILRDDTGSAVRQYEVRVVPTSYFLKRDGTVSEAWTGPLPDDVLNAALAQIR